MRLQPGIVWPNGRAYAGCSVLHLAGRYVGRLLFSALLAAAKRGVRVRLLLDDNNTPGLDDILRLLDSHPRIEVRLLILSRFACCVRLVISPTFPVLIAVCTIKVSLSMAW